MARLSPAAALGAAALALASCGGGSPPEIATGLPYGTCCVDYGDGRQPGVAVMVPVGTPVIAPADGKVLATGSDNRFGGYFARLHHDGFDTYYTHLSRLDVFRDQNLKRGEAIGLSGTDSAFREYLQFNVCKIGGDCLRSADTYDPAGYWLGGRPTCFDPDASYAATPNNKLTAPTACGSYAGKLRRVDEPPPKSIPSYSTGYPIGR